MITLYNHFKAILIFLNSITDRLQMDYRYIPIVTISLLSTLTLTTDKTLNLYKFKKYIYLYIKKIMFKICRFICFICQTICILDTYR